MTNAKIGNGKEVLQGAINPQQSGDKHKEKFHQNLVEGVKYME